MEEKSGDGRAASGVVSSSSKKAIAWLQPSDKYIIRLLKILNQLQNDRLAHADTYEEGSPYSYFESITPENKNKNMYTDILPYDRTRVGSLPERAYVNASYIDSPLWKHSSGIEEPKTLPQKWIAAQGPLPRTINDFLGMTLFSHEHEDLAPQVIVMLTAPTEGKIFKCHNYIPTDSSTPTILPPSTPNMPTLSVLKNETIPATQGKPWHKHIIEVRVQDPSSELHGKSKTITHFEYLNWRDRGVPDEPETLIDLVDDVRASNSHNTQRPIIVHCSAGVGRTGVFISVASLLDSVRAGNIPVPFDATPSIEARTRCLRNKLSGADVEYDPIFLTINHLRDHRLGMVQSSAQVIFIYQILAMEWNADRGSISKRSSQSTYFSATSTKLSTSSSGGTGEKVPPN